MKLISQPLVFVDIETNGLDPYRCRVIEVAAIRVEQGIVTGEYTTLINPGTELPYFITNLTGITTKDVQAAPDFSVIAPDLAEILEGAIFVAHNVNFDYSFLQQEFKRLDASFAPPKLCTVRLSRALYPQHKSHTLASLIERYDLRYADRHRAYDDAHILWQFMQHAERTFDTRTLGQALRKQVPLAGAFNG